MVDQENQSQVIPEDTRAQVGLSEVAHRHLKRLKEDEYFGEMKDAYLFAVALSLAHGAIAREFEGKKTTIFGLSTIDPDGSLRDVVSALRADSNESVTTTIELLAEWGVQELHKRASSGTLSFSDLLSELQTKLVEPA